MEPKILIIGNQKPDTAELIAALKDKGELIMDDKKKDNTIEFKPNTVKTVLEDWAANLKAQGIGAFWPSWAYGQYIKPDNRIALDNKKRLATRRMPDVKKKVVCRHGKNVLVDYKPKEVGAFFKNEKNHLGLVTSMINMPRNFRRTLSRKLKMQWSEYREAEAMIREG